MPRAEKSHAKKVLVVDDEPQNLQLVGENLRRAGIPFIFAIDGTEALHAVSNETPALILLDVMMPGKDGFEVCRELKANPATADIPVIFLTAASEVSDLVSGFAAGAVDYIKKPFIREELLARVHTHLNLSKASHELQLRNQQQNELLARLAHDVKNPSGAITGLVHFIREDLEEGSYETLNEVYSILDIIKDASSGMTELVNTILNEAKAEASSDATPIYTEIDVCEVAEHLVQLNRVHAAARNQSIEFTPSVRPEVAISRQILTEMFDNLLSNAVKYSRDGSTIQVRLLQAKELSEGLRFEVEDSAATIEQDLAERLFKRFSRGDQATTGKQSSHGVGLAIVKRLVALHHGKVGLYARETTGGNVFYIELPTSEAQK